MNKMTKHLQKISLFSLSIRREYTDNTPLMDNVDTRTHITYRKL